MASLASASEGSHIESSTSTSNKEPKTTTHITSILILIAMAAEAEPLIASLSLTKLEAHHTHPYSTTLYTGTLRGVTITVATNGQCILCPENAGIDNVGTTPAALTTLLAMQILSPKPDLVINAGTAGGFSKMGAAIGDAFVSTHIRHHDRRIPIPGWDFYAKGHHSTITTPNLCAALKLKSGVVSTGNSLDCTDRDMELMLENGASVKDMEAASIAWVLQHSNTPFFCLKVVTDIVDSTRPTQEEFMENLAAAAQSLQRNLRSCVDFIDGKSLGDL